MSSCFRMKNCKKTGDLLSEIRWLAAFNRHLALRWEQPIPIRLARNFDILQISVFTRNCDTVLRYLKNDSQRFLWQLAIKSFFIHTKLLWYIQFQVGRRLCDIHSVSMAFFQAYRSRSRVLSFSKFSDWCFLRLSLTASRWVLTVAFENVNQTVNQDHIIIQVHGCRWLETKVLWIC